MLAPGTWLQNRYNILQQIGGGGMGAVYLAEDNRLARTRRAIKEMNLAQVPFQDRGWAEAAFRQEAQILSQLSHLGLTRVTDFFAEGGNLYLVMDYVPGQTLEAVLDNAPGGRLPLARALDIMRQLCQVLAYLHAQNPPVIFRDLKPANVMLTAQDQVRLIDFGIARFFKSGQPHDTVSLGTPGYAAPEQWGTRGQSDARSDIYGLGVLLLQLVTGYDPVPQPFPLPGPSQVLPGISPEIEALILRATQTNPDARYQSVAEFRQALLGAASSQALVPPQPSSPRVWPSLTIFSGCWLTLLLLGGAATCVVLVLTPIGEQLITGLSDVASEVPSWAIANWPWMVLAVGAGAAVAGRRVIASVVSSLGSATKRRPVGHTSPFGLPSPPPPPYPSPPTVSESLPQGVSPSGRLRYPEWLNYARKPILPGLLLKEETERLRNFIVRAEGGRFVLTGYGHFSGTSLIRGAMSKARQQLEPGGSNQGALLVFYFKVKEGSEQTKFEIEANEFSVGVLTTKYGSGMGDTGLKALKEHADETEFSSDTSSLPLNYHFSLTQPIGDSFFRARLPGLLSRKRDFDFNQLVTELNEFLAGGKTINYLQEIVLRLIGSEVLPSRVVIILDRIERLETLDALAQAELFKNERITVIAVAHKEDLDRWQNRGRRLKAIGFREWYVPCLWQRKTDYVRQIVQELLELPGGQSVESEENIMLLCKHLEFIGRGSLGKVLYEFDHIKYWQDGAYLDLGSSLRSDIKHDAWRQGVLDENWKTILASRFPRVGKEDRARIGVYYLLDWIAEQSTFTKEELLQAALNRPITISDNPKVVGEVILNLLYVLAQHRYLELRGSEYRVRWDETECPEPATVVPSETDANGNSQAKPNNRRQKPMLTPEQQAAWEILKQAFSLVSDELRQRWQMARESGKAESAKSEVGEMVVKSMSHPGVSEPLQTALVEQLERTRDAAQLRMITDDLRTAMKLAEQHNHVRNKYREKLAGAFDPVPIELKIEKATSERDKAIEEMKTIFEKLSREEVVITDDAD